MKKNLPSIYKNPISKNISNNMNSFYSIKKENKSVKDLSILNEYIFNMPLEIELKDEIINAVIVSNRNNYIITNTNRKINIDDIITIKRKGQ